LGNRRPVPEFRETGGTSREQNRRDQGEKNTRRGRDYFSSWGDVETEWAGWPRTQRKEDEEPVVGPRKTNNPEKKDCRKKEGFLGKSGKSKPDHDENGTQKRDKAGKNCTKKRSLQKAHREKKEGGFQGNGSLSLKGLKKPPEERRRRMGPGKI